MYYREDIVSFLYENKEGDVFVGTRFSRGDKRLKVRSGFLSVCASEHVDMKPGVFEEISSCYMPLSLSVSFQFLEKASNFCFSDISWHGG